MLRLSYSAGLMIKQFFIDISYYLYYSACAIVHPSQQAKGSEMAFPKKHQLEKLYATGRVADVENEGMDEGRFFVHLKSGYGYDTLDRNGPNDIRLSMSFGGYAEAMREVKLAKIVGE